MATRQASSVDSDWEDVGGGGEWEDTTALNIKPVPTRQQLLATHEANRAAGAQAYRPGWIESATALGPNGVQNELLRGAKDAILNTPQRIGSAVKGIWNTASELVDPAAYKSVAENPIVDLPGKIGAGLIGGTAEALISPSTTGEAGTGALIDTATGMGLAKGAAELRAARSARHASAASNHLAAALELGPNDARGLEALDKGLPILRNQSGVKRPFRGSKSFADFAEGGAERYFKTHHEDLAAGMKGMNIMVGDEAMSLERGLAERARLNKRLNRYDSVDPKTQGIMEETNPSIKADIERRQAVRDAVNAGIDTAAPQSASQAEIMRNYSHLLELSEMARKSANKLEIARRVAAGSKPPLKTLVTDTAIQAGTGTLAGRPLQWTAAARAKALRAATGGSTVDPEMLFRRASRRFQHIKPAVGISPVPIEFPNEPVGEMPVGQTEMPFAPPGIGAMGSELPLEQGPPRAIQMPNRLTQEFNRPLTTAEDINQPDLFGQTQMPFVAPQIGNIPGTRLPRENPTAQAFYETARGQRNPTQRALPSARSIQLGQGETPYVRLSERTGLPRHPAIIQQELNQAAHDYQAMGNPEVVADRMRELMTEQQQAEQFWAVRTPPVGPDSIVNLQYTPPKRKR